MSCIDGFDWQRSGDACAPVSGSQMASQRLAAEANAVPSTKELPPAKELPSPQTYVSNRSDTGLNVLDHTLPLVSSAAVAYGVNHYYDRTFVLKAWQAHQPALVGNKMMLARTMTEAYSQPTVSEEMRRAIKISSASIEHAELARDTAVKSSEGVVKSMRRGLYALAGGEVINFGMDATLFKGVETSKRTTVTDFLAPAVVLTRMPWQLKVGAIVGTHLLNRGLDAHQEK